MKKQGFSLMEMMIILLIVSVAAAASAPIMSKRIQGTSSGSGGESSTSGCYWNSASNGIWAGNASGNETVTIGGNPQISPPSSSLCIVSNNTSIPQIVLKNKTSMANIRAFNRSVSITDSDSNKIGDYSTAMGYNVSASGNYATAFGDSAKASKEGCSALGKSAEASGIGSIAVGYSKASGGNSIAVGAEANSYGEMAVSIGSGASAGNNSIAMGNNAKAKEYSIAIGRNAAASNYNSIAIGTKTSAANNSTIAIGNSANASKTNSVAIGSNAVTRNNGSIALGNSANASGSQSIALGARSEASGANSVAIGYGASVSNANAVVIGDASNSSNFTYDPAGVAIGNPGFPYAGPFGLGIVWPAASCTVGTDYKYYYDWDKAARQWNTPIWYPSKTHNGDPYNDILSDPTLTLILGGAIAYNPDNYPTISYDYYMCKDLQDGDTTVVSEYWLNKLKVNGTLTTSSKGDYTAVYGYIYPSESDRRLKDITSEFTGGLAELKKLKIYNYVFKNDSGKTPRVGVIAQDLKKIFPDAVSKDTDGYYAIRTEDILYSIVNAVKELDKKIAILIDRNKQLSDLENYVASLEQRASALEQKLSE